jgi:hypothetical protein
MLVAKAVLLQSSAGAVGRRELSQAGWDLRCRRISFRIFSSYVICWPEHVEVLQAVVVAESGPQNPIEPDQSDMKWYEFFWIPSIGWKACAWVCCVLLIKAISCANRCSHLPGLARPNVGYCQGMNFVAATLRRSQEIVGRILMGQRCQILTLTKESQ